MILDPALVEACAPTVTVSTVQAIVERESHGNPFAVNLNGGNPFKETTTYDAARARVAYATAHHMTADVGLMQINSSHIGKDGLTVEALLDPCTNLRAGARILTSNYEAALLNYPAGQPALMAALSMYNTGNFKSGFANGYVAQYYVQPSHTRLTPHNKTAKPAVYTANPIVFERNVSDEK